jgi:Holliday junction DNA helicase RuvA
MIAFLRGPVAAVTQNAVIVDVGGIGYRVEVPLPVRARLPAIGEVCTLHTSLQVREDAMLLYGFTHADELALFELLVTVSGIGPKVALALLSALRPEELRRAVVLADYKALQAAPGVGQKLAQRLVLELKDKLGAPEEFAPVAAAASAPAGLGDAGSTAVAALLSLGFARAEAAAAVTSAGADAPGAGTEELVRLSLQRLGRG